MPGDRPVGSSFSSSRTSITIFLSGAFSSLMVVTTFPGTRIPDTSDERTRTSDICLGAGSHGRSSRSGPRANRILAHASRIRAVRCLTVSRNLGFPSMERSSGQEGDSSSVRAVGREVPRERGIPDRGLHPRTGGAIAFAPSGLCRRWVLCTTGVPARSVGPMRELQSGNRGDADQGEAKKRLQPIELEPVNPHPLGRAPRGVSL